MSNYLEAQTKVDRRGCFVRDFTGERSLKAKLKQKGVVCLDLEDANEQDENYLENNEEQRSSSFQKLRKLMSYRTPYLQDVLKEASKFIAKRSNQIKEFFTFNEKEVSADNSKNSSASLGGSQNEKNQSHNELKTGDSINDKVNANSTKSSTKGEKDEHSKNNGIELGLNLSSSQSIKCLSQSDSQSISNRVQHYISEQKQIIKQNSIRRSHSLNQSFRSLSNSSQFQKQLTITSNPNVKRMVTSCQLERSKQNKQNEVNSNYAKSEVFNIRNNKNLCPDNPKKFKTSTNSIPDLPLSKKNSIAFSAINETLDENNEDVYFHSPNKNKALTNQGGTLQLQNQPFSFSNQKAQEKVKPKVQIKQVVEMKAIANKNKDTQIDKSFLKKREKYVADISNLQKEAKNYNLNNDDTVKLLLEDPEVLLSREGSFLAFPEKQQRSNANQIIRQQNQDSNSQIFKEAIEEKQSEWSQSSSSSSSLSDLEEDAGKERQQSQQVENQFGDEDEQSVSSIILQNNFDDNSNFSSAIIMPIVLSTQNTIFKKPQERKQLEQVQELQQQFSTESDLKNESSLEKQSNVQVNEHQQSNPTISLKISSDLQENKEDEIKLTHLIPEVTQDLQGDSIKESNNIQVTSNVQPSPKSQDISLNQLNKVNSSQLFMSHIQPQSVKEVNIGSDLPKETNLHLLFSKAPQDLFQKSEQSKVENESVSSQESNVKELTTQKIKSPSKGLFSNLSSSVASAPASLFNTAAPQPSLFAQSTKQTNNQSLFPTPQKKQQEITVDDQKGSEMTQETIHQEQPNVFQPSINNTQLNSNINNSSNNNNSNNQIFQTPQPANIFGGDQVNPFGQKSSPFGSSSSNMQGSSNNNKGLSLNDLVQNTSNSFKFQQVPTTYESSSLFTSNPQSSLFTQNPLFTPQNNLLQNFNTQQNISNNNNLNGMQFQPIAPFQAQQNNSNLYESSTSTQMNSILAPSQNCYFPQVPSSSMNTSNILFQNNSNSFFNPVLSNLSSTPQGPTNCGFPITNNQNVTLNSGGFCQQAQPQNNFFEQDRNLFNSSHQNVSNFQNSSNNMFGSQLSQNSLFLNTQATPSTTTTTSSSNPPKKGKGQKVRIS